MKEKLIDGNKEEGPFDISKPPGLITVTKQYKNKNKKKKIFFVKPLINNCTYPVELILLY